MCGIEHNYVNLQFVVYSQVDQVQCGCVIYHPSLKTKQNPLQAISFTPMVTEKESGIKPTSQGPKQARLTL